MPDVLVATATIFGFGPSTNNVPSNTWSFSLGVEVPTPSLVTVVVAKVDAPFTVSGPVLMWLVLVRFTAVMFVVVRFVMVPLAAVMFEVLKLVVEKLVVVKLVKVPLVALNIEAKKLVEVPFVNTAFVEFKNDAKRLVDEALPRMALPVLSIKIVELVMVVVARVEFPLTRNVPPRSSFAPGVEVPMPIPTSPVIAWTVRAVKPSVPVWYSWILKLSWIP